MIKVLWNQAALDELASIWIQDNPKIINSALLAFLELLKTTDPEEIGESRRRLSERFYIGEQLCFLFTIEFRERERVAVIRHVWKDQRSNRS